MIDPGSYAVIIETLLSNIERGAPAVVVHESERHFGPIVLPFMPISKNAGDLIMAVDGRPVTEGSSLQQLLRRKRAGDSVELQIFRDGRRMRVEVTLGDASRMGQ